MKPWHIIGISLLLSAVFTYTIITVRENKTAQASEEAQRRDRAEVEAYGDSVIQEYQKTK